MTSIQYIVYLFIGSFLAMTTWKSSWLFHLEFSIPKCLFYFYVPPIKKHFGHPCATSCKKKSSSAPVHIRHILSCVSFFIDLFILLYTTSSFTACILLCSKRSKVSNKRGTHVFVENIKRHWTPSTKGCWFGHNINCRTDCLIEKILSFLTVFH